MAYYQNIKPTFVDLKTFNEHLKRTKGMRMYLFDPHEQEVESLKANIYCWEDQRSNQHLMYRDYFSTPNKTVHIALDLYDLKAREDEDVKAHRLYQKYLKPLVLAYGESLDLKDNDTWLEFTTEQYQWIDVERKDQWMKCWSYDVNSQFLSLLDKPLPCNVIKRYNGFVQKGEIGYDIVEGRVITSTAPGTYCRFIFDTMQYKSLTEFKRHMYEDRINASTDDEKRELKVAIVCIIGYLKYKNVFLRSTILHYAKQEILKYKDKDTVYCNTDSIVSTRIRDDIPVSQNCGDFKAEHRGRPFVYRSVGIYAWHGERMKYKGMKTAMVKHTREGYYVERITAAYLDITNRRMIKSSTLPTKEIIWQNPEFK